MRVLVLSDTHIPVAAQKLPKVIEEEAKRSQCCLHAGDFITYNVFQQLQGWAKVYAVYGNMDSIEVRQKLNEREVIHLEGITIGLIHGKGAPFRLMDFIRREFCTSEQEIDIFVFGHSHCPIDKEENGKIYFNPGSPTDRVFSPHRSYGILEIENKQIRRRLVKIE
ncbi:MAG: metallophosphoesterase [Candidatus Omnitrophota bacterium]|nr:MAG: metallophosphoesterase [Candidatus Omnitrophota bacterium]